MQEWSKKALMHARMHAIGMIKKKKKVLRGGRWSMPGEKRDEEKTSCTKAAHEHHALTIFALPVLKSPI